MNQKMRVILCALAMAGGISAASAQQHEFADVVRNLRNPDTKMRVKAVRLLRESGYTDAIVPMASLVNDPVDDVQLEAIDAELSFYLVEAVPAKRRAGFLGEIRRGKAPAAAAFDMGPLAAWPRPVPPELTKALLQAVDDENGRVRQAAIYALGVIARPPLAGEHVEQLVKALDHYDPAIRAAAARVAGRLKVTNAGDALIKALNDGDAEVRYAAMRGLGDLGEERAVQALTDQLTYYGKGEGASAALYALARIAHPSSVPVFRARINDKNPELQRAAAEGLGRAKDASQISELETIAGNAEAESVRAAACFALQLLGKHYVARLIESMDSDAMAPQITGYLVEIGPSIVPMMPPYLQDPDPAIRANVAEMLSVLGGETSAAALRSLLDDADKSVVQAATRGLERIKMTQ